MSEVVDKLNKVKDKESFIEFVRQLIKDQDLNESEWENKDIYSYLEAASAWLIDSKRDLDDNPWKLFAEMLYSGKIYE